MTGLSIVPELLAAIILALAFAWFFEDRISFNKGVLLGPYEWIFKTERKYYRLRRSVSDVTSLIFQNQEAVFKSIREEMDSPYFEESEEAKGRKERIRQAFKKVDFIKDPEFAFQTFVLGSLLHGRLLLYVISRKRDRKTGEPKPFPSGQTLVAKRPVMTISGFQSRRLVEGDFILLQKKHRIEGLLRRPTPVGIFVPDEDTEDRQLMVQMEKVAQPLHDFAVAIRTERQYGLLVKDLTRRLQSALSEQKRLINRLRTAGGESLADRKTTDWYERNTPKGTKIANSMTPVVMFLFPIIGGAAFEYLFRTNAILGVILGSALAMMLIGVRGGK